MTFIADYHIHLERGPFTREWARRFIENALSRGVTEVGFSEHGHRFPENRAMLPVDWVDAELDQYLRLVRALKDEGLPVKLGLEMDYVPGFERPIAAFTAKAPFDYVIGSVHFIDGFCFDDPKNMPRWQGLDVDAMYVQYFRILGQAARSGLFDTIGHPDVIKVFGFRPASRPDDLWQAFLEAAKASDVALEVSAAGWYKPVGEMYPDPAWLPSIKAAGIPITLASDAHDPESPGRSFDRLLEQVTAAGIDSTACFTARQRTIRRLGRS